MTKAGRDRRRLMRLLRRTYRRTFELYEINYPSGFRIPDGVILVGDPTVVYLKPGFSVDTPKPEA